MRRSPPFGTFLLLVLGLLFPSALRTQWVQDGSKFSGGGAIGTAGQGNAVAISADSTTVIVGASSDSGGSGAVWVFSRGVSSWGQQGAKLVPSDAVGKPGFGISVAVSADGNTVIVGGPGDNSSTGAAWTRNVSSPPRSSWRSCCSSDCPSTSSATPWRPSGWATAILGLRSLYFVLAGAIGYFRYLKVGLALVLVFVGVKMIIAPHDETPNHFQYEIPIGVSLLTVVGIIVCSIIASVIVGRQERKAANSAGSAKADGQGGTGKKTNDPGL